MKAFISLCTLSVAILYGIVVQAHTALVQSVPADGATEQVSPPAIELVFGAEVRLVDLQLADAAGQAVELAQSRDLTPAKRFRVAVPALAPGNYRVNWVVMGGDSHKMSGQFGFAVEGNPGQ